MFLNDYMRSLFVQYVTLRDLWSLCKINHASSLTFDNYLRFSASTDTLDSFFEIDEFDSLLFLRWCDKNNIVMKKVLNLRLKVFQKK